jgi:hypothetical protein
MAALSMVKSMVENRAHGWLEPAEPQPEPAVQLAAPWPGIYDQPAEPPPFARFDPWSHTLRSPGHRTHTLGHRITHRGPCTHACATAPAEPAPEPAAAARTAARGRAARRFWARP